MDNGHILFVAFPMIVFYHLMSGGDPGRAW